MAVQVWKEMSRVKGACNAVVDASCLIALLVGGLLKLGAA